jgi:hypothetical protein
VLPLILFNTHGTATTITLLIRESATFWSIQYTRPCNYYHSVDASGCWPLYQQPHASSTSRVVNTVLNIRMMCQHCAQHTHDVSTMCSAHACCAAAPEVARASTRLTRQQQRLLEQEAETPQPMKTKTGCKSPVKAALADISNAKGIPPVPRVVRC